MPARRKVLLALIVLAASCASFYETPEVRIVRVRVLSLGLTEGTAALDLAVSNPNRRALEVLGVRYRVDVRSVPAERTDTPDTADTDPTGDADPTADRDDADPTADTAHTDSTDGTVDTDSVEDTIGGTDPPGRGSLEASPSDGWQTLGEGFHDAGVVLGGRDTTLVTVEVPFRYEAVGATLRALFRGEDVRYRLDGEVRMEGPVGEIRVPVQSTGSVRDLRPGL